MYIKRTTEAMLLQASQSFPCLVIYGPRQIGKSTTVNMLFSDTCEAVTLDDLEERALAEENPRLFLEAHPWPLIIDEIQKVPKLLDEIKKKIDAQRLLWLKNDQPRQLMYVLTGSNRFELQQGISDSLAGRCGIIEMSSFSQVEKHGATGQLFSPDLNTLQSRAKKTKLKYRTKAEIFADIFQGGMPDICTENSERDLYFKSYLNTYIEKDVRKLIAAGSELQFRNFISLLALRTSQELHYEEIANSSGIDVRTAKKWLSILETSGIVYLLTPYLTNAAKRIIKAPKLYFMDTGLCAYLCKWPNAAMLENCAMSGAFFETYVVSELIKNSYAYNKNPHEFLFYYRDTDQKEIDLLFVTADKIYPIEIKKSTSPKKADKNFSVLKKFNLSIQTVLIIDNCEKIHPRSETAWYYPVSLLGD